jgi:hypothetical protein
MAGKSTRAGARRGAVPPAGAADRIVCETPTPGKQPVRIEAWKYLAVRDALLRVLPAQGRGTSEPQGLAFRELPALVWQALSPEDRAQLGSASWYTTTVKLDLEVKGQVRRLPGSPQRLVRTAA